MQSRREAVADRTCREAFLSSISRKPCVRVQGVDTFAFVGAYIPDFVAIEAVSIESYPVIESSSNVYGEYLTQGGCVAVLRRSHCRIAEQSRLEYAKVSVRCSVARWFSVSFGSRTQAGVVSFADGRRKAKWQDTAGTDPGEPADGIGAGRQLCDSQDFAERCVDYLVGNVDTEVAR